MKQGAFVVLTAGLLLADGALSPERVAGRERGEADVPAARHRATSGAATAAGEDISMPGARHEIRADTLPLPSSSPSDTASAPMVQRSTLMAPKAMRGFSVQLLITGLKGPRTMRYSPNGDLFVAESKGGRISLLRSLNGSRVRRITFLDNLQQPSGLAFYPARDPRWLYVATVQKVIRYPYRNGASHPLGLGQTVIGDLPSGGHWTRSIAFAPDEKRLYVAVGSATNDGDTMEPLDPAAIRNVEKVQGRGAGWGDEAGRAMVLASNPLGRHRRNYATGLRNCAGLTVDPKSGAPWCVVNERDDLGDDLVPDFAARLSDGDFYGWPWYYLGRNQDPQHRGARPDLATDVRVPEILLQAHSAPLDICFYRGGKGRASFPYEFTGDAFVTFHGSWNRSTPTGYKVVRLQFRNGKPTGAYQDFLTGFALAGNKAWGRPTGLLVAPDGALLVSEDASNTIWRISWSGRK